MGMWVLAGKPKGFGKPSFLLAHVSTQRSRLAPALRASGKEIVLPVVTA